MCKDRFFISISALILCLIVILVCLSITLCYTWRDFFGTIIGALLGLEGTIVVIQYYKNNTRAQIKSNMYIHDKNIKISQIKMFRQNLLRYEDKLSDLNDSLSKIKANINLNIKSDSKLDNVAVSCKSWIMQLQSINGSKTIIFGELGSIFQHIIDLCQKPHSSKGNVKNILNQFNYYERLWTVIINQTCGDMSVFIIRNQKGEYSSKKDKSRIIRLLSSEFNEFLNDLQDIVKKISRNINKI